MSHVGSTCPNLRRFLISWRHRLWHISSLIHIEFKLSNLNRIIITLDYLKFPRAIVRAEAPEFFVYFWVHYLTLRQGCLRLSNIGSDWPEMEQILIPDFFGLGFSTFRLGVKVPSLSHLGHFWILLGIPLTFLYSELISKGIIELDSVCVRNSFNF